MPIGPWELAIMMCFGLPVLVVVLVILLVQRQRSGGTSTPVNMAPASGVTGQVQCPACGTSMSEQSRFCPGCGVPRTHVQMELYRQANETGVPYETLLDEARRRDQQQRF